MKTTALRRLATGGGLFCDGDWVESPYITDSGVRLIQTGNVGVGYYKEQGDRYVSAETFDELQCTEVLPNDVLICRLADPVGRSCLAPDLGVRMVTSVDVAIFRPRPGAADPRFINYWLSSTPHLNLAGSIARGGTRQRISREQLGSMPALVLRLEEQRAIADYLDAETARIDALIAKKQQLIHLLEERRRAVLLTLVVGADRQGPFRETIVPWARRLPDGWREASLKLVARLGSGHTPSRDHPEWWIQEECVIPWVTTGEVSQMRSDRLEYLESTRERISEIGMHNSSARLHPAGSVVLCRTAASAGYSAILNADMATSQDIVVWTCGPLLEPRFLLLCMRAMRDDLLDRLAMGSTHKTIYMPDIESIRVPLPPTNEQLRIVDEVWTSWSAIDSSVDCLCRQIELLAEHRQALITAAVIGEFAVPGAA